MEELAVRIIKVVNSESVLHIQAWWILDQEELNVTAILFHFQMTAVVRAEINTA